MSHFAEYWNQLKDSYFPRRAKGVSIATLQGLLEEEDYKVASKAFTEMVAFNCFKVLSHVLCIKNLEK